MRRWLWFPTFLLAFSASAGTEIGKIENAAGGSLILRARAALPTTPGTILQLNDIVRTEPGGLLRLALADGSALMLGEGTELRVAVFDTEQQQTLIELLHGRLRAEVKLVTKPSGRFLIRTPTAAVYALGSVLDVATVQKKGAAPGTGTQTLFSANGLPLTGTEAALVVGGKIKGMPGSVAGPQPLSGSDAALTLGTVIKGMRGKVGERAQPAGPQNLEEIQPGANSLGDYQPVSETLVTTLNGFVGAANFNSNVVGAVYLQPGETTCVARDRAPSPATLVGEDGAWQQVVESNGRKGELHIHELGSASPLMDFDANGRPCTPGVVANGNVLSGTPNYKYKILGTGISTGNALQITITNEGACALYFFVRHWTILRPKGFTGRIVTALIFGTVPNLKNFQDMGTVGGWVRLPAPGALLSGPAAAAPSEATMPLRSYCVELHKLAPHPKTEYKFGDEGDQKRLGPHRSVVGRAFELWQRRQLLSTQGHGLDSVVQWTLWAKIESMDEKKFMEEFTSLVHKNFEAKKQKWDKEAQRNAAASGRDLWQLAQIVLK